MLWTAPHRRVSATTAIMGTAGLVLLTRCMVRPCVARGFVELAVSGLASMYPAFDLELDGLLAIMENSAPASSLADRPQRAIWVTSVRMRREDRYAISSHPLADLGR